MTTNSDDETFKGPQRTMIRVGDTAITITLLDVKAIQAALLDYLAHSDYPDRDELIPWTRGDPAWIDSEGDVRIGPWLLDSSDSDLILRYREPAGQNAAKAHVAYITKNDGHWAVTKLLTERISIRR